MGERRRRFTFALGTKKSDLVDNDIIWLTLEHFSFVCSCQKQFTLRACKFGLTCHAPTRFQLLLSPSLLLSSSCHLLHHMSLVPRLLRCKVCYIIAQSVADWRQLAFCMPSLSSSFYLPSFLFKLHTVLVSVPNLLLYAYF